MKILIVAGTFPPYAPSSASRVNKLAKFLDNKGHEIKVLAPRLLGQDMSLEPEISEDKIIFTDYYDINKFPTKIKGFFRNMFLPAKNSHAEETTDETFEEIDQTSDNEGEESKISFVYRALTNIPDATVGWYPEAVRKGRKIFSAWSPDIIFSTAPPYTGFLVAHKLAKIIDVPWVADYRDLWIDETYESYDEFIKIRKNIDVFAEKRILSNCKGLVTVTNTWSKHLKETSDIPVEFVMNGYDPDDFNSIKPEILYPDHLTILYAGELYGDKRDPSALFVALGKMGDKVKDIKVLFYTPEGIDDLNEKQKALIEKYKIQDQIVASRFIPQSKLHQIQSGVDILLLLRWDDPKEDGVIAGKLFEYIGADKPILSVGSTTGEAADIIRDNDFGIVSKDPEEISNYLETCLKAKAKKSNWHASNKNKEKFTRSTQFEKLEKFMEDILKNNP